MWHSVFCPTAWENWVTCYNDMQQVIETGLGNVGQRCVVKLLKIWIGWISNL